jgi:hypothetical protein
MRETDLIARIHEAVKKQLPRAVYIKINDLSTTGIPDLEITYGGRTTHVEVKLLRLGETPAQLKKHFSALQLATCRLLELQGRCVYFVAAGDVIALLLRPHQVACYLDQGARSIDDLLPQAFFQGTRPQAIDHLIWVARQP